MQPSGVTRLVIVEIIASEVFSRLSNRFFDIDTTGHVTVCKPLLEGTFGRIALINHRLHHSEADLVLQFGFERLQLGLH